MGVGFSYSLLNVGSGLIIGLRVSFWLAAGGALGWIFAPLLLVQNGLLPDHPTRTQVLYFVMWPGIGMVSLSMVWVVLPARSRNCTVKRDLPS